MLVNGEERYTILSPQVQEGVKLFYHKPNFTLPLRPGAWRVKMMYQWEEGELDQNLSLLSPQSAQLTTELALVTTEFQILTRVSHSFQSLRRSLW